MRSTNMNDEHRNESADAGAFIEEGDDDLLPAWGDRIKGTRAEEYLKIYRSTEWAPNSDDIYSNIVDTLCDVLDAQEAHIHLLDAQKQTFIKKASHLGPLKVEYDTGSSWDVGLGRSVLLINSRRPQILDHAHPHPEYALPYDEKRYSVCFTLGTMDNVLGICSVCYYEPQDWDESDMDHFSIIGVIIGSAIDRLRTAERMMELAILNERKRLGTEIHDNVVQCVHAVSLNAAAALAAYEDDDLPSMSKDLELLEANCKKTVKVFRDEMLSLKVPVESERVSGLIVSIEEILDNYETNWGIRTSLVVDAKNDPLLASTITVLQMTRILNEALTNTLRHAEATEVEVSIFEDDIHLVMTVKDNGKGFDVNDIAPNHWGLEIMRERADLVMGRLDITSDEDGTVVVVDVPRHV